MVKRRRRSTEERMADEAEEARSTTLKKNWDRRIPSRDLFYREPSTKAVLGTVIRFGDKFLASYKPKDAEPGFLMQTESLGEFDTEQDAQKAVLKKVKAR